MMRDEYRWTDRVISPERLRIEFLVTLMILAFVVGVSLAGQRPAPDQSSHVAQGADSTHPAPNHC